MYVKHIKKSEWLDCQRKESSQNKRGFHHLVKIEHKNTATLDSARSKKKKSKVAVLQLVKHMKTSKWLDCQGNEFFPKQKGIPSLVKIEHKNTATLDSARSKKI